MINKSIFLGVVGGVMAVVNVASATIVQDINIDFLTIANVCNTADSTGRGAVGYSYSIGKYEVTNAQWNTFTAAAGAPTGNPSNAYDQSADFPADQQPTGNISWYEAAQFCNYLTSGDKSLGAYHFNGNNANAGDFLGIDRAAAISAYGIVYVIPTEDEWYKAAYYKPDESGYSLYSNGLNTIPGADNGWNYHGGDYDAPWDVGTGTEEQNGTFDMMGNVTEWNETLVLDLFRRVKGGSFYFDDVGMLASSSFYAWGPSNENGNSGFRIACVSEPVIEALIDVDPDTLNKRSHNKWITVYITLPDGFDVGTIDTSNIAITSLIGETCDSEYTQEADLSFTPQVGDRDEDGILDLTVKFDCQVLLANLCLDDVSITIEGELTTGELFSGSDSIRIIDRGK